MSRSGDPNSIRDWFPLNLWVISSPASDSHGRLVSEVSPTGPLPEPFARSDMCGPTRGVFRAPAILGCDTEVPERDILCSSGRYQTQNCSGLCGVCLCEKITVRDRSFISRGSCTLPATAGPFSDLLPRLIPGPLGFVDRVHLGEKVSLFT